MPRTHLARVMSLPCDVDQDDHAPLPTTITTNLHVNEDTKLAIRRHAAGSTGPYTIITISDAVGNSRLDLFIDDDQLSRLLTVIKAAYEGSAR
jgi:hypothetical protein